MFQRTALKTKLVVRVWGPVAQGVAPRAPDVDMVLVRQREQLTETGNASILAGSQQQTDVNKQYVESASHLLRCPPACSALSPTALVNPAWYCLDLAAVHGVVAGAHLNCPKP